MIEKQSVSDVQKRSNKRKMAKNKNTKTVGVSFLCKDLHEETYEFGKQIKDELGIPIYFIIDSCNVPSFVLKEPNLYVVLVSDNVSVEQGFQNCMITGQKINTILNKNPISYDKFLYFFCRIETKIDFLFVFEDDVFIPSVKTVDRLIKNYSNFDLITPNNFPKTNEVWDWHWKSVIDKIPPPYYYSMVSAFGISRNLLNVIDNYVIKNHTLFFTEVMFNTLAMQNKLKVIDAFELKSVVWLGGWCIDDWLLLPNNVFHPMKKLSNYASYREALSNARKKNLRPPNNLPSFIKDLM